MSDVLKLKYKVGEIEFEAEGPAEAVELQRVNFMNAVLPAAVEAMVRTRSVSENRTYIEATPQQSLLRLDLLKFLLRLKSRRILTIREQVCPPF